MSLQQVSAFYEMLISEPAIYNEYYNKCCRRGFFNTCHWDKTKIISFAATLGYNFNETELEQLWFDSENVTDYSLNLSEV